MLRVESCSAAWFDGARTDEECRLAGCGRWPDSIRMIRPGRTDRESPAAA